MEDRIAGEIIEGGSDRADDGNGRGSGRDPEGTRRRILMAAIRDFTERGLDGARVDAIADAAGVNKRMLYHYYGNKEALFGAAVEEVYRSICHAASAVDSRQRDPLDGLRHLIRAIWAFYRSTPEAITLLNSANLHKARHISRSSAIRAMETPFVGMLSDLLARGEAKGVFRRGVDPVDLYVSIVGLCYYYLSNNHTLSVFFDRDFACEGALERWGGHIEEMIVTSLSAR